MKHVLSLLALAASACVSVDRPPPSSVAVERRAPVTILVSIDGLRPDDLRRGNTPTLDGLASEGASGAMRPSFPANTFPNHYTLVTGLRPDRHGVVDNTMEDPARPGVRFTISDTKQTRDRFWWDGAEPIWVSAERAGIRAGTMFWPGAEAAIGGVRPSVWVPYAAEVTSADRVRFVLDWLRRPVPERPGLLTLYFDVVDKAAHEQGFESAEQEAA
ncbi:ectonucleotide pyrophosphatase/phosphodiesterase, partial [uncultured Sphingomonas sp.]|uniref:alkaline phosphatase family protein n=1 Tax=uncultured Sphingomonas sp. TaxID=158754 RepID=UPI0035CC62F6